jgi:hypothetical protein
MLAIAFCIAALAICYWAGRRSLGQGLVALLTVGYFYGILRANLLTTFSHFIFDAGLIGLYLAMRWGTFAKSGGKRGAPVRLWTILLIVWPVLLVAMPFQPLLVSLVGLRGSIFFIPLLLLGSRMKGKDLLEFAMGLAVLNLVALCFAVAEYFLGVPRFFPYSPVTRIMYASGDVAGGFLRIPAIFTSAAAFGGTMVATMPFLIGLWTTAEKPLQRLLGLITIPAAMLGILMSATRSNFIYGCAMIGFILVTMKMTSRQRVLFVLIIGVLAVVALTNTRFQRFKSLQDTDYVSERIAGSVNRGFWEIISEYPMGNGLGGGGTSIPYFLEGQVRNPIGMENEYARILAEQGIIGLLLWLAFLAWFYTRAGVAFSKGAWATPRKLLWGYVALSFATAWIGTGLLTSIPSTVMLIIGAGFAVMPPEPQLPGFPVQRMGRQRLQGNPQFAVVR